MIGLSMGYKKDIFAVFAYEFELSHIKLILLPIFLRTNLNYQTYFEQ